MIITTKRLLLLSTGILVLLCGSIAVSKVMAAELKPIQEITLCTWTKTQYPIPYEESFMVAENWKKLGIQVRVEPLNLPNPALEVLFKNTDKFDAYIAIVLGQMERVDPDFFTFNTFHSSNVRPGGWNMAGFINKDFDRLAEMQRTEFDFVKRKAIVDQCQQLLYKENPWISLVNPNEFGAYNKADFKDPVIPKIGGFWDPFPYFTIKPTGERKVIRNARSGTDLKTANPLVASEGGQWMMLSPIYDPLLRIGPDIKPQFYAAESLNTIDQRTHDVTLRKGLKFHDGKPLTVADVKFSYDYMMKHNAPYFKTALDTVESVEILDNNKVRFHLKKPYATFVTQTLAMVPILPKHVWEKIENPTEYNNVPPIGSGPFKFEYWKKGQEFKLARFSDHFKPPYVDGLLVIFYGTNEAAVRGLIQKEADVILALVPEQLKELKKYDYIQTVQLPSPNADTMILNCKKKPFNDPKFRLAMTYTIPRKQMLDELYHGYGNLGASIIGPANVLWTDPSIKPRPFDLEQAKTILKEAGYRWDDKGRLCYPPE